MSDVSNTSKIIAAQGHVLPMKIGPSTEVPTVEEMEEAAKKLNDGLFAKLRANERRRAASWASIMHDPTSRG